MQHPASDAHDARAYLALFTFAASQEEWDPHGEEAVSSIEEDWISDTQGETSLDRERFYDSLFELADTCTHGVFSKPQACPRH